MTIDKRGPARRRPKRRNRSRNNQAQPQRRQAAYDYLSKRYGWKCWLCGKPIDPNIKDGPMRVTLDHATPRAFDGEDDYSNYRLAHQGCNNKRGCMSSKLARRLLTRGFM